MPFTSRVNSRGVISDFSIGFEYIVSKWFTFRTGSALAGIGRIGLEINLFGLVLERCQSYIIESC